jgi:CHAT domain-containing protein/Tfp pilus assembly protein PilF
MLVHAIQLLRRTAYALCLVVYLAGASSPVTQAQVTVEDSLRNLVEKFYSLYQEEEIEGLMLLWSAGSPDLAAAKKSLQQTFEANDKIKVERLSFGRISVAGEKAEIRVSVEISGVDAKTGKPSEGLGKQNRTLHLIKDAGVWKIWRGLSSEEELAAALAEAKTDVERNDLIEANNELMTADLVTALLARGGHLYVQGKQSQALAVYTFAGVITDRLGDRNGRAAVELRIGNVHLYRRNFTEALEYYGRSLELSEKMGNKAGCAPALNNIGVVYRLSGDYPKAIEHFRRSLAIKEETGDKTGVAGTLTNLGLVCASQGNFTEALEYYDKALTILETGSDKYSVSLLLNNMGVAYRSQGDYAKGLECYQKSLKIAEEIGDKITIGNILNNIGSVHQSQGNYSQALEYHERSLDIAREIDHKSLIGSSLHNIGNIYQVRGDYAQALKYYQARMRLAEDRGEKTAYTSISIGIVHRSRGEYAQAVEHYEHGLKIASDTGDRSAIALALASLAYVDNVRGNHAQAIDRAQRAADLARQIGYPTVIWQSCMEMGYAYETLGRSELARKAYEEAIAAVEEVRVRIGGGEQERQRFFEGQVDPYHAMVNLLVRQNQLVAAFTFAERAKGRALLDTLHSGKVRITTAMSREEQEQESKLVDSLVSLNARLYAEKARPQPDQNRLVEIESLIENARLDYEGFMTSLYAAHPELKVRRGQAQPISLEQADKLIRGQGDALLEYVVTEKSTQLFVLTKPQPAQSAGRPSNTVTLKVFTIKITEKELASRVSRFRERLANRYVGFSDEAKELYDVLLGPARRELANKTNLIIAPDGALWELPFQALKSEPKRYLIQDAAVSYAPSLTVLHHMKALPRPLNQQRRKLLALGNPSVGKEISQRVKTVFMDQELGPLPEAERQVKLLKQLYGSGQSKVYVGPDASENRVKAEAPEFSILHIAAHGILNDKSPMYSHLLLSQQGGSRNEDGLLEAWEILKLDLKADLVVLSACETARGRIGNGEGMIGLAWACFVAGAPTTVVSQWKVESRSTTELMVDFHRNLLGTERPARKADALRRAALKLLKTSRYNHPFYWAAFIVVGDGR